MLHNYLIDFHIKFVQFFIPKPIDKWAQMWYNIGVKGRAERQSSHISETHERNG